MPGEFLKCFAVALDLIAATSFILGSVGLRSGLLRVSILVRFKSRIQAILALILSTAIQIRQVFIVLQQFFKIFCGHVFAF